VVGIGLPQPITLQTSTLISTWDRVCSNKYALHA